jgi:hypothetical protein
MTLDDKAITLYEHQQTPAEPAYKKFLDLVGSIEYGGLDFLQGLHDRLEVELLLGHFHGAHKHLYRAAADLCEDAIKERLAQQKAAAREHRETVAMRMHLLLARAREILGEAKA